jgi:hypothetical protein
MHSCHAISSGLAHFALKCDKTNNACLAVPACLPACLFDDEFEKSLVPLICASSLLDNT